MDARTSRSVVESLEWATLAAVGAHPVASLGDWLLPMSTGTVGRAHSAVPLHHGHHDTDLIGPITERYRAAGRPPVLRVPDLPAFEGWHLALAALGFRREQPTHTQIGLVDPLRALTPGSAPVSLRARPTEAWMALFLGPGLDPLDGASRSRALAGARDTLYASVEEDGRTVACGAGCYAEGWLGVHGLRTDRDQRGRGHASAILQAMACEAQRRGIGRVFLQVDAENTGALSLYQRAGLRSAWVYAYWRPVKAPA